MHRQAASTYDQECSRKLYTFSTMYLCNMYIVVYYNNNIILDTQSPYTNRSLKINNLTVN